MDADLKLLMADRVPIAPRAGRDLFQNPTYGAAVEHPARVVGKVTRVKTQNGEEKVSTVTVYVDTVAAISLEDQLTLPGGWLPRTPQILKVQPVENEDGPDHTVLYC